MLYSCVCVSVSVCLSVCLSIRLYHMSQSMRVSFLCSGINIFYFKIILLILFFPVLDLHPYHDGATPSAPPPPPPPHQAAYVSPPSKLYLLPCDIMLYSCASVCLSVCTYLSDVAIYACLVSMLCSKYFFVL